jgi:ProP effector
MTDAREGGQHCVGKVRAAGCYNRHIFSSGFDVMGFEQLATLRDQLARDAERERVAKVRRKRVASPSSSLPDPVVLTIAKLQKRFPQAFPRNPAPKMPLKVGILEDLVHRAQELGLSEAELRDAMKTWCRGHRYWTCLTEGAARIDLTGNEAGRVSPADAARARMLKARRPAKASSPAATAEQAAPSVASGPASQQGAHGIHRHDVP